MMLDDFGEVVCVSYCVYVDKNCDVIEVLIVLDFYFMSLFDNWFDCDVYLVCCWLNSVMFVGFEFVDVVVYGEYVFVVYEVVMIVGWWFCNVE